MLFVCSITAWATSYSGAYPSIHFVDGDVITGNLSVTGLVELPTSATVTSFGTVVLQADELQLHGRLVGSSDGVSGLDAPFEPLCGSASGGGGGGHATMGASGGGGTLGGPALGHEDRISRGGRGGSGGACQAGAGGAGGWGGGSITLVVERLDLSGTLDLSGQAGQIGVGGAGGGGAGGGVSIAAGHRSFSGVVDISGGAGVGAGVMAGGDGSAGRLVFRYGVDGGNTGTVLVDGGPGPGTVYDAVDLHLCPDLDGDLARSCVDDCDDGDPDVHPGATELTCNGVDNDCDGLGGPDDDDDGDGLTNSQELSEGLSLCDSDSDGDGVPDVQEFGLDSDVAASQCFLDWSQVPAQVLYPSADGVPDGLDPDDDGDGIPTHIEGSGDSDGDGHPDHLDPDSDDDGWHDGCEPEAVRTDPQLGPMVPGDNDGDNLSNAFELSHGLDPYDVDTDRDGIADCAEIPVACPPLARPDVRDVLPEGSPHPAALVGDDDGDGIPSLVERLQVLDLEGRVIDDGRCVDGTLPRVTIIAQPVLSCGAGVPIELHSPDFDHDGVPDHLDPDDDGDGIDTRSEGLGDSDNDGILDYLDILVDGSSFDRDGDGVLDSAEQAGDSDGDGVNDIDDDDDDGDGIPTAVEGQVDSDRDDSPNYLDTDSDNDGIPDSEESAVLDSDGDGLVDFVDPDDEPDPVLPERGCVTAPARWSWSRR